MNEQEFLTLINRICQSYPINYEHIISLVFMAGNLDEEKSSGYSENLLLKALMELDT